MFKILVVEDTLTIREEVCDILLLEGYQVCQAENGQTGFNSALKELPDLIISDFGTGWENNEKSGRIWRVSTDAVGHERVLGKIE